ncbi:MAG: pyruvate ferredoxin oxidoreductase [Gammaproteobacteria bacterium]|nr:pyruvate ferredoxin oxidoreductase [Gammaproteobacteria bacterium]MCW8910433.1 pyruvate ferredoxin oxidoreductase [Gammaproteobacteria bacterium]MCW9005843.1 pyruvate ferredoxin oxidoreductase [Gammaproteobacteria bacterium]MCW9056865.1 pyruvate ferredoxin oxidoreductase [Gammaproteobacteria bacterium]
MLKQVEGSIGVAEAIGLCRPDLVCAYPITPQTHIVEGLADMVRKGKIKSNCQYINVESEFAALSVCIGSSATGVRSYTATSSQGLLFMAEAVYNAAGMRLPIVMTIGNRAIGGPINIWNDQSDSMSMRDAGWIQIHAETNQEAGDLHIQAFKIAEQLSIPVMVCVDGFLLTHAYEQIESSTQEQVDEFLPPFKPMQALDCDNPMSMGAMVGPEAFMEVRALNIAHFDNAIEPIQKISEEFEKIFGRKAGGLYEHYNSEDADTVVVSLGSVNGTVKDIIDEYKKDNVSIGSFKIGCYRPFPGKQIVEQLKHAKRIIVVEKDIFAGVGGCLANDMTVAFKDTDVKIYSVIGGLGGRPIFKKSLIKILDRGMKDELEDLSFIDLDQSLVEREITREDLFMTKAV